MMTLLLALLACHPFSGGKAADTGDIGDAGDTADTSQEPPHLLGAVEAPEDTNLDLDLSVAAVLLTYGDGPVVGETLAAAALDGAAFDLFFPALPPKADVGSLGGTTTGAIYGLVAFEDSDGDGAFEEGEHVAGVTFERALVWLEDPGDSDLSSGWSLLDLGMAGQYELHRCFSDSSRPLGWRDGFPVVHDLGESVSIALHGLTATVRLAGAVSSLPDGITGMVGLPWQALSGADLPAVFDLPIDGLTFEQALSQEPPASMDIGSNPDWRYVLAVPLLYQDDDGDGIYGSGDGLDPATACYGNSQVYARYNRPIHTWQSARLLDCYGGNVGWRAVTLDPEDGWASYLSAAEAADLLVDGDLCRFFGSR